MTVGDSVKDGLWRTDGTAAGTTLIKSGILTSSIAILNNRLYFFVNTELWESDGTASGSRGPPARRSAGP